MLSFGVLISSYDAISSKRFGRGILCSPLPWSSGGSVVKSVPLKISPPLFVFYLHKDDRFHLSLYQPQRSRSSKNIFRDNGCIQSIELNCFFIHRVWNFSVRIAHGFKNCKESRINPWHSLSTIKPYRNWVAIPTLRKCNKWGVVGWELPLIGNSFQRLSTLLPSTVWWWLIRNPIKWDLEGGFSGWVWVGRGNS